MADQPDNRDLQEQLDEARRQLERASIEYRRKIEELTRAAWQAQKRYAVGLQEQRAANEILVAAMHELNTRLRMLLTSRLLHLGWWVGLGATPYWNDPGKDELTDLLDQTRPKPGADSRQLLQKLGGVLSQPSGGGDMESALNHLVEKGFSPKVVLDIGAAKGYWTLGTAYRWKQAEYYMIDPLAESEPALRAICQDPRFHYLRLAVGDTTGEMPIHVAAEPDGSSLLLAGGVDSATHQTVTVRTLDQLLETGDIKPAQLIKIDVQGFELNVLQGASKLFEHAEVFIIEANFFEFMPGCPRVHELIAFMAERGFYPFDFAGFLRRPFENDLGQIDIVFVHHSSPMVASTTWLGNAAIAPAVNDPEPPSISDGLAISVIICTKDPQPEIFARTLDALDRQTLDRSRFEVIIVDNASTPPLQESQLNQNRFLPIRLVREAVAGLGRARVAGISAASGGVLVFVDDDNFLDPDYLQKALEIAQIEPRIGLFGGIAVAELGGPMAKWKAQVLPHLGIRHHGDWPITRFSDRWGEWEPIGAGMVARRRVADRFVEMFNEIPQARMLGRSGSSLLSGEDSLFARAAFREGFACSYQPSLKLTHYLKSSRLTFQYMSRVVEGHGRSYVILQRAMGNRVDPLPLRTQLARLIYRIRNHGRAGLILARWERGYAREVASPSQPPPQPPPQTPPQTPALRYAQEPDRTAIQPGPSAYLRTGVGDEPNRLNPTSPSGLNQQATQA